MNDIVNAVAEHAAKQAERSALADEMNTLVRGGDKFTAESKTRCEEIQVLIDGDPSKQAAGLDYEIKNLSMQIVGKHVISKLPLEGPSAFQRYMSEGDAGLTDDERKEFLGVRQGERPGFKIRPIEALTGPASGGSPASGVGLEVLNKVIESLQHYGGVREMAYQFTTNKGDTLHVPNWDTSTQKGSILGARAATAAVLEPAELGQTEFTAHTYTSGSFGISNEYLQDAAFSLETLVPMRLMRRIGKIQNEHFTTGSGNSEPQGLVEGAKAGVTAAAADEFEFDELVQLIHSVDPAYREGMEATEAEGGLKAEMGRVGFMFHDSFISSAKQLQDNDGRPLWLPNMGVAAGAPNTILGYPYAVNQNLQDVATGHVPALFGNFGYYGIRNVQSMTFHRFTDSAFASKNQIGFLAFTRTDAKYIGGYGTGNQTAICQAVSKFTMG